MDRKYGLVLDDTITHNGVTLYRIKALKDFSCVKAGEYGGYIEKEDNLSHKGCCWVSQTAKVYGNAKVSGDALVYDNALVYGYAHVYGDGQVFGDAIISDNTKVYGKSYVVETKVESTNIAKTSSSIKEILTNQGFTHESINNVIEQIYLEEKKSEILKFYTDFMDKHKDDINKDPTMLHTLSSYAAGLWMSKQC